MNCNVILLTLQHSSKSLEANSGPLSERRMVAKYEKKPNVLLEPRGGRYFALKGDVSK